MIALFLTLGCLEVLTQNCNNKHTKNGGTRDAFPTIHFTLTAFALVAIIIINVYILLLFPSYSVSNKLWALVTLFN